ncbi:MAG TPA: hypothetical protein EYP90_13930, partial [Chromatiaceae bacterium]|nr:hypothetical protein [Chromatiaceae bacterium]
SCRGWHNAGIGEQLKAQFDTCLDSGKFAPAVRADWDAALGAGARGTPTFMVNGRRVTPFYEDMAAAIEAELSN